MDNKPHIYKILKERTEKRRELALFLAKKVCRLCEVNGVNLKIVGSLSRGNFKDHSDVDFLSLEPVDIDLEAEIYLAMEGFPFNVIELNLVKNEYFKQKLINEAKNASELS